jgi:hypothetical protein
MKRVKVGEYKSASRTSAFILRALQEEPRGKVALEKWFLVVRRHDYETR